MKQKTIRLSRIKISNKMKANPPRPGKIKQKYYAYWSTGNLLSTIIVDKRNNLLDGYTSYLIAKMFGIKKVDVSVSEK